jgi:hypothetical protein
MGRFLYELSYRITLPCRNVFSAPHYSNLKLQLHSPLSASHRATGTWYLSPDPVSSVDELDKNGWLMAESAERCENESAGQSNADRRQC